MKKRTAKKSPKKKGIDDRVVMILMLAFLIAIIFILDAINKGNVEEKIIGVIVADRSSDDILVVDTQKVQEFVEKDYYEIKEELGIDRDFSVYFEDEYGNIVPIAETYCIGSPKGRVAEGIQCG